jgi:putative hydrolase of the HAD superfamily
MTESRVREVMIQAVLFDFGGVLAEEGFRHGLEAIGVRYGQRADNIVSTASALAYSSGYVEGRVGEPVYWNSVREITRVSGTDEELRQEIISRFIVRPEMIAYCTRLRASGRIVGILSDQTNWLEEILERECLEPHFDHVFNSFRLGKSKRDPSVFTDVCADMGCRPSQVLFVDDNEHNVQRAAARGLQTIRFISIVDFGKRISPLLMSIHAA